MFLYCLMSCKDHHFGIRGMFFCVVATCVFYCLTSREDITLASKASSYHFGSVIVSKLFFLLSNVSPVN